MTVIMLSVIFIGLGKFIFTPVKSASVPTLFINDKVFSYEKSYPVEVINGVEYVPNFFFNFFPNVEWDNDTGSFYFWYKREGFITFNVNTKEVYDAKTNKVDIPILIINDTYYIPAAAVAEILGIQCEIDPVYHVVRLRDSAAVKSLAELIAPYTEPTTTEPTITVTTATEPTTAPPVTETTISLPSMEPTTTEDVTPRDNRLIFENFIETSKEIYEENNMSDEKTIYMKNDNLYEMLNILSENNYKSVFFFNSGEIEFVPEIINEIYARGHEIGIKVKSGLEDPGSYESIKAELDRANGIIYTIIKKKTQLYLLNDDFYGDGFKISHFEYNLKQYGYFLCKVNDSANVFAHNQTKESLEGIIRMEELNTFLINVNTDSAEPLGWIFEISRQKDYITVSGINISNLED